MNEKNRVLPFITKKPTDNEDISYQAELACVVCMAESQRKKPSFLREVSEKIAFISKVHYPMWILATDNSCLIADGLNTVSHGFVFEEPTKTAAFMEELKKNSVNPQKFMDALKAQAMEIKEFTAPVKQSFAGVIDDRELLGFLETYFGSEPVSQTQEGNELIPQEIDAQAAAQTSQAFTNCLRTMQADAKGVKYALAVLKEELEFHQNAAANEIEKIKTRLELETAALKPIVDKAVKKLTQKQDKAVTTMQRSLDRKIAALEKRREKYIHKLQVVEQKKDAVQRKMDAAKKKKNAPKSSAGSFAYKKYEREAENIKKEIKAISEELDKTKKEGENKIKSKREEYQSAIAQEEDKLTQLNSAFAAKTKEKQKQIQEMTSQAADITSSLENRIDDLKRSGNALRSQVEVNCDLGDPDEPVLAQLPMYLIKYTKGEDEKFNILTPIALTKEGSVLNGLKKILTLNSEPKLKTLIHPANRKLQETLNANILEKMQSDPAFRIKMNEVCRASNLIDLNTFGLILNEGLDEIEKKGWITKEEAAAFCKNVMGEMA
ncbi:MAG: hypothetical protein NWF05_11635 [Candidatus Bathyarchaeota archaeon]|nr:hypothetical protein [Candidatus Bathyarchaeota archaeon]